MLGYIGTFFLVIIALYKVYKMKMKRLTREETMFYQIYNNIKDNDPSVNKGEN